MTNIIEVDFGRKWYKHLEELVQLNLDASVFPGVEILFAAHGQILLHEAWGKMEVGKAAEPMRINTVFDMASLTKPVVTATAIMMLMERGKLDLEDPVCEHLPEFKGGAKDIVTLKNLLTHTSGLPDWENLYEGSESKDDAWAKLMKVELTAEPGKRMLYSCLDFLILGEIIRRISGISLTQFAQECIFDPLLMESTCFKAWQNSRDVFIAPTQYCPWRKKLLRGIVHDENSYIFDEEGGNAGMFSTALDLHRFSEFILNEGELEEASLLSPHSVHRMLQNHNPPAIPSRAIGWDYKGYDPMYYSCGDLMPVGSLGHTGFTGTSMWLDQASRVVVIVLTNRVHISRENQMLAMKRFRPRLHNILISSLESLYDMDPGMF